jgi:hypothetical protein
MVLWRQLFLVVFWYFRLLFEIRGWRRWSVVVDDIKLSSESRNALKSRRSRVRVLSVLYIDKSRWPCRFLPPTSIVCFFKLFFLEVSCLSHWPSLFGRKVLTRLMVLKIWILVYPLFWSDLSTIILTVSNNALKVPISRDKDSWNAFVAKINRSLDKLDLEFRQMHDELSGKEMYAIVSILHHLVLWKFFYNIFVVRSIVKATRSLKWPPTTPLQKLLFSKP